VQFCHSHTDKCALALRSPVTCAILYALRLHKQIPLEAATNQAEVEAYKERVRVNKKQKTSNDTSTTDEEEVFEPVELLHFNFILNSHTSNSCSS
jgi:hypothetical protein